MNIPKTWIFGGRSDRICKLIEWIDAWIHLARSSSMGLQIEKDPKRLTDRWFAYTFFFPVSNAIEVLEPLLDCAIPFTLFLSANIYTCNIHTFINKYWINKFSYKEKAEQIENCIISWINKTTSRHISNLHVVSYFSFYLYCLSYKLCHLLNMNIFVQMY